MPTLGFSAVLSKLDQGISLRKHLYFSAPHRNPATPSVMLEDSESIILSAVSQMWLLTSLGSGADEGTWGRQGRWGESLHTRQL